MTRAGTTALVFLSAALAAAYLPGAPAGPQPRPASDPNLVLPGTVVRVVDGDTADVRLDSGEIRVRFHGIDAPEAQAPYGRQATAALRAILTAGRDVELMPVEQDRYDRLVAVVYAGGASVNEDMIAQGFAWAYRGYLGQVPGDQHYCELEGEARAARRGLWSQPAGLWVPPWIWRERQRAEPGAKLPSKDYAGETAAECMAEIGRKSGLAPLLQPLPQQQPVPAPGAGCDIKGNINGKGAKIYHVPGEANYEATRIDTARGERWFCTEEEARAAGWRAVR